MALGDYILCCKCEVKLIYDGDRGNREWWKERWGTEPEIICPDCAKQENTADRCKHGVWAADHCYECNGDCGNSAMPDHTALLRQALEALESFREISDFAPAQAVHAIKAIKEELK